MTDAVKKRIKIALWCILGAIMLFVFIILGSLLVQKFIKKEPVPMIFGYASMIVITGSMNGTIDEGDMIVIKKTNDYELGDIVTFLDEGKVPITHRLVNYGDEEGTFITKGDANNTIDRAQVSLDQIAGEVVLVIPKVGIVFNWVLYGGGIIYIISMIAIIIAGVYFWNILKPEEETEGSPEGASEDNSEGTAEDNSTDVQEDAVSKEAAQSENQSQE